LIEQGTPCPFKNRVEMNLIKAVNPVIWEAE